MTCICGHIRAEHWTWKCSQCDCIIYTNEKKKGKGVSGSHKLNER